MNFQETLDSEACSQTSERKRGLPAGQKERVKRVKRVKRGADIQSILLRGLIYGFSVLTLAILFYMIGDIVLRGIPGLTPPLFSWTYSSENVSLMPSLINTLSMIVLCLLISIPVSVGCAIFLVEFARPDSRFSEVILLAVQTLSGVPSIVFGLFGSIFFVRFCHLGLSLISGALTMVMMILPLGIKTTQEALQEVPSDRRQSSYALGAGKVRTIFKVVLPGAAPGILNGIVLSTGRIVGESAALIFTAGTLAKAAPDLLSSVRTLAVHMYVLSSEGLYIQQTYSTALILLLMTVLLNGASQLIQKWMKREK